MLEESITSSPQKPNRSIHKVRIHRKNKRLQFDSTCATLNQQNSTTEEKSQLDATFAVQEFMPSLADLYWEEKTKGNNSKLNTELSMRPQLGADFDPFEDELLLAVADRLDCARTKSSRSQFAYVKTGHGFASCSQLFEKTSSIHEITEVQSSYISLPTSPKIVPIITDNTAEVKNLCKPVLNSITNGPKTQFGVTESELLHFCDIAEGQKEEKHQPLKEVLQTPELQKRKSIVESILEDFCSSPASPDGRQEQSFEADGTPIFRFKNQQIRTYTRRRRVEFPKLSYTDGLENVKVPSRIEEDDVISNCSSGLSVQEDLTQPQDHSMETVDLNNKKLIEMNLMNLSAYFTQHSVDVDSSQEEISSSEKTTTNQDLFESKVVVLNQLINEIITLRKRLGTFKTWDSYLQNSVEFYGFPMHCKEENSKVSSVRFDKITSIGEINDAQQLPGIVHGLAYTDNPTLGCSYEEEDTALKQSDEIFSESEEEWNDDCDFFRNFKTQDAFHKSDDTRDIQCQGFISALKKPIATLNKPNLLSDIDIEQDNHSSEEYLQNGFKLTSAKEIQISAKPQKKSYPILDNLSEKSENICNKVEQNSELLTYNKAEHKLTSIHSNLIDADFENIQLSEWPIGDHTTSDKTPHGITKFKGFQTASNKCIKISDEAKLKAAKLLENLPDFPNEIISNSTQFNDLQTSNQLRNENTNSTNDINISNRKIAFQGFQTASNKSIEISDDAKLKAAKLLENLPDFPDKIVSHSAQSNEVQTSNQLINEKTIAPNDINTSIRKIEFKGFQTASNKSIKISNDSKSKAAKILENLPDFPEQKAECSELNTKKNKSLKPLNQDIIGFRTASRKLIQISEEAKLKAENILSSLPEIPTFKSNIPTEEQLNDIQLSEWPLDEQSETEDGKPISILPLSTKRKLEPEICNPVEQIAKILCKSYSTNDVLRIPLTLRTENCLPKSASFDTFTKNISGTHFAKSELIARKNLLSLRKRRKSKTAQELNIREEKINVATTPLKAQRYVQTKVHTPDTPNLNEFIEFIPDTSTPRTIKINCFKNVQQQQSKVDEIDSDFQQIKWEERNESMSKSATVSNSNLNFTKLADSSNANITLNTANPSPKQRIERLRMYGKPPPVSPILMSSKYNCRPSGLRRGRSMTKK